MSRCGDGKYGIHNSEKNCKSITCDDLFNPSPRHKNQTACKKVRCQRAKKAAWQRHKMKTDPDYKFNQKLSQKQWVEAHSGYWKDYRKRNPEKAERNRILQAVRNRRVRSGQSNLWVDRTMIAKMDALGDGIKP